MSVLISTSGFLLDHLLPTSSYVCTFSSGFFFVFKPTIRWPQKAVELLLDSEAACLSFVGERGTGKLERVLQAWNYVRERGGFGFDAIFYANCVPSDILDECPSPPKEESRRYTEGVDNRSNFRHQVSANPD